MNRLIRHEERGPLARLGLWDPDFDRMFESFLRPASWVEEAGSNLVPTVDVAETENDYLVKAEMPGVKKEDIAITLENGVLTLSGETQSEKEEKEAGRVIRQERRYGKYVRSLHVGTQVDEKRIKAAYKDGVLEVTIPKAEEIKPKRITVGVA